MNLPLYSFVKITDSFSKFNQPKPRIDYTLKAVGGHLTAIPGISDMIDVSFLGFGFYFLNIDRKSVV